VICGPGLRHRNKRGVLARAVITPKKRDLLFYRLELETIGYGGFFTDLADAQAWLNAILASHWWRTRSKIRRVDLSYGQVKMYCIAYPNVEHPKEARIDLTRARLCENYILHELAHLLAWPADGEEQHGPKFVGGYLGMLRRFGPKLHWDRLRRALEANGFVV
jgi:hypothetical protein